MERTPSFAWPKRPPNRSAPPRALGHGGGRLSRPLRARARSANRPRPPPWVLWVASGLGQRPTRKPLRSRSGAEPGRGVAGGRCVAPSSRSRFFRAASKSRALAPLNIPTAPYRVANRAGLAPGHQRFQADATGAGQHQLGVTARQPTIGLTAGLMTIAATNIAARLCRRRPPPRPRLRRA